MRFLLRWVVRLGTIWAVGAAMAASPFVAGGVWWLLLAYLVWAAWSRLAVDVPRLWRLTAFRGGGPSRRFRLGRLKGDTL